VEAEGTVKAYYEVGQKKLGYLLNFHALSETGLSLCVPIEDFI